MRTLIVDDEPLARRRLRELLGGFRNVECVGEAVDAPSAVRAIDALRPDLVFLDVQMPNGTGLDVLKDIRHEPAVIFTTAHDQYAVAAFELQAVDYLLKPFGHDRLGRALERVVPADAGASARARAALSADSGPVDRILVRDRGHIVPIAVRDIVRLEADDDYTAVYAAGRRYLVYLTLKEFEQRLDSAKYVRVHRSHVVNLDHVAQFTPADGGRLTLQMADGTTLPVSRIHAKAFRDRAI